LVTCEVRRDLEDSQLPPASHRIVVWLLRFLMAGMSLGEFRFKGFLCIHEALEHALQVSIAYERLTQLPVGRSFWDLGELGLGFPGVGCSRLSSDCSRGLAPRSCGVLRSI
jgi:hypothetical protein